MSSLATVKDILQSDSKRRKVRLLLSEQVKIRFGANKVSQPTNGAPCALRKPVEHGWTYNSRVKVPAQLMEEVSDVNYQDVLGADGIVRTDFEYNSCRVNNAYMYTNGATHISVFNSNGKRLPRYSFTAHNLFSPASLKLSVTRRLSGRSLNLYGNLAYASGNIGHWTVDGVPRLFLSRHICNIDEIDHFIVPPLCFDFQIESLVALGVDKSKIIELQPMEVVQFDELICTSAPRDKSSTICPGWIIDAYREALGRPPAKRRRIYISRRDSGSRKFVNEDAIANMLSNYDFEIIELSKYNFQEKIRLFEEAECVVGLTGAGMTNLMFCNPGTSVIELVPSTLVNYIYASMSGYLGLDYHYMYFEDRSESNKRNRYFGNFELDVAALESMLQATVEA